MAFCLQYYAIPIAISCQSICLSVPGGDGEKLINGWVRASRGGWTGPGQDVSPWLGSGSGSVRGTRSGSAPGWHPDGWGSSLGLDPAPSPSTKPPVTAPPAQGGASPHLTPGRQRAGSAPPWQWQEHAPGCARGRCHSEAWGRVPSAQPERMYWLHLISVISEAFTLQFYYILTLLNVIT